VKLDRIHETMIEWQTLIYNYRNRKSTYGN
jgi:hypothetical protein